MIKREIKRIEEENNRIYLRGQEQHSKKVKHLVAKHCNPEQRRKQVASAKEDWLHRIS